jgi:beta-carotene ketolase (CrtO type)
MFNTYLSDRDKIISSINSPPADLRMPIEKIEQLEYRQWYTLAEEYRKQLQSMRSWCDENFESDEAKVVFGTFAAFVGLSPDDAGGGELCHLFASIIQDKGNNVVRGGFVNLPKALAKFIESRDGAIMTNASVTNIIIENGKAMGVILANGKSITAKKLAASSTDPSTLILKLIGEDYVDSAVINSIKRIEWGDSIFGIYLALDRRLEYRSDQEVSGSSQIHLSPPTLEYFSKIFYECRSGMIPNNPLLIVSNDSIIDPSLQNVYLCGSGNHPGPGVSMAPGRNAAQVILSDLGIDFKKLNG